MDNFMIATLLLLTSVIVARAINERAVKKLEQTKKAQLIDLFSGRIYTSLILILILALFFITVRFELLDLLIAYAIYTMLIFAYVIMTGISSYRKLKSNEFPDSYIQSYLIATSLRVIGLVIFFALVKF